MLSLNRREFISAGAMAVAGVLGSAVLDPGIGTTAWAATPAADPSRKKILVAYDTGCGSTVEVARAISQALGSAFTTVDLRLVGEAEDPKQYDAVVVGSAVRRGRWLNGALEFVGDHGPALSAIPTAYFLTCVTLYHNTAQAQKKALSFLEPTLKAAPAVKPISLGLFAGALDYDKLNPIMRMVMKSKMENKGIPEGDFRDFTAIKAWAGGLAPQLGLAGKTSGTA